MYIFLAEINIPKFVIAQFKCEFLAFLFVSLHMLIKYSGTCLIWHTKGSGKCVGLYKMTEYSGFILVNRNTLGS
jgi:hypothetical protein